MEFSRTGSKEDIIKITQHIAEKVGMLVRSVVGYDLPITYLTIFSHTPYEYNSFVEWAKELGDLSEANNGVRFALKAPIKTVNGDITQIRIRKPDVYRSQIGCADVKVGNYLAFKEQELLKHPDHLRLIKRPEYEMIEFFDFGSNDVLAYALSK